MLLKLKHNFCFEVNIIRRTTKCVTLYMALHAFHIRKKCEVIKLAWAIPAPMRPPPMTTNSLMGAEALAEVDRPRAREVDTVLARNDILEGGSRRRIADVRAVTYLGCAVPD